MGVIADLAVSLEKGVSINNIVKEGLNLETK